MTFIPDDGVDESTEASWMQFLARFDREIWPIFEPRGFSRDTALMIWTFNKIENGISDMKSILEDMRDLLKYG